MSTRKRSKRRAAKRVTGVAEKRHYISSDASKGR